MPNNFWDDFFPATGESEDTNDQGGSWINDYFSPIQAVSGGLPTEDWNPEYQKSEGWTTDFTDPWDVRNLAGLSGKLVYGNDNPINRAVGKAGAMAGELIMKGTGVVADLFQNALNSSQQVLDNPDAFGEQDVLPGRGLDAYQPPKLTHPELLKTPEALAKKNEWDASPLGVVAETMKSTRDDAYSYSKLLGEVNANLSTKKDEGGNFSDELSTDIVNGNLWEGVKDTAGMMLDTGADMTGMAAAGVMTGAGPGAVALSNEIGAGMALSVFGDTYQELTQNEDDSRALALVVSAADAMVEQKFETIGWEAILGKGALAKWMAGSAKDSFTKAILARMALAMPTEGGEEAAQGLTNILAKNLPNVGRDGWEATYAKILKEAKEQIPEQAFVGAVFGGGFSAGVAGPQHIASKLAAKDVAARFGGMNVDPKDQLANAIDKPPSEDAAQGALLDVVEQEGGLAGGGDLSGVVPIATVDSNGNMVENRIGNDAGNGFIHGPEGYRVRVSTVSATGGVMLEKRSETGQASGFYIGHDGNLIDAENVNLADPQSVSRVWKPSSAEQRAAAEAVLREASVLSRSDPKRKEVLGKLREIVNGNMDQGSLDVAAKQEKIKKAAKNAKAAKKAADQAIKDLSLDAEKQRAELANGTTSSDIDAAAERITKSIETVVAEKQAQVDTLMGEVDRMAQLLQGTQPTFNTGAEGEQETVQAPQIQATPEEVSGVIQAKAQELGLEIPIEAIQNPIAFDWGTWGQQQVAQAKESVVEGLKGPVDAIRSSITVEPDSPMASVLSEIPEPTVELPEPIYEDESVSSRQLRFARLKGLFKVFTPNVDPLEAAQPVGEARGTKVVPGISNPEVNVLPKFEAVNRYAKNFKYDKNNSAVQNGLRSMGNWLKGEVLSSLGESSLSTGEREQVVLNTKKMVDSHDYAQSVMPAMKRILFNVWQTAPADLVDRLGRAHTYSNDANPTELATLVADHLAGQELYSGVAEIIKNDPAAMAKFSVALIQAGKGVMSPWSMERIMLETGVDVRVAKAAVAAMQAMSERWAMKKGKDVFEWWDRIGDIARVGELKDSPWGLAYALTPTKVAAMKAAGEYMELGKGMMTLFKVRKAPGVKVALHETIHLLYFSGLMYEMLDAEGRAAMEELAGEKLWDSKGEPLEISGVAHERMAVGFEKFVMENDAPNKRMRAAFDDVKQWFANYIKNWMQSLGVPEKLIGPAHYSTVPAYGEKGKTDVYLEMGDLDIAGPQIRAFYQLLNANPDGTEIAYSAPGISTAVEELITATTGIDAKGVLTLQPPAPSLITLPVFPKDRVVTADDLPDADDAANTKWFHGSGNETLHQLGLTSFYSKIGLVGTGLYLTDDPSVADSYRRNGIRGGSGDGQVYALKVEPKKVINLEKVLPNDVVKILSLAFEEHISEDDISSMTGMEALNYIREAVDYETVPTWSVNESFVGVESWLRQAGYDAYTHVGGVATNSKIKHRVLVLLDPKAELNSGYPETRVYAWPTVKIDPTIIEDDWSIHEPNGPSDSQWRRMIGLTNDESNGTHTHATLLEMAKDRERVADLAKRTHEQERMATPPSPQESRATVAREVLSSVGDGILEGEPLLEEISKHLHDTITNGGRDGFNSGVPTDPTKMDQVKDMLTNFVSKMRSWAYLTSKGDFGRVGKEFARGALYAIVKPMQVGAKAFEKSIGNFGADWANLIRELARPSEAEIQRLRASGGEAAVKQRMAEYESMSMLSLAEFLNNNHALSKLADKVAELRPQLYDIVKHVAVQIPGARSFNEITTTFNRMAEAYYAANKHKLTWRDGHEAHEAMTRDLRLWMFSARQFELVDRVKEDMAKYEADLAEWEKASKALKKKKPKKGEVLQELEQPNKPKKPKLPQITEEGTRWAESVKMLMEMRYGKNLAMFKATAQELTQWENHMVLDKLLNVGMITAKEHADMYAKGKHHIPMYRLRSMLDQSGAMNTRLDDSMYKVLDYLKHDISMKMEDPINAMLRKAAGIEMLTMRQHAKNAIGKRILADVRWWDIDYKDAPLSILHKKEQITKEEYDQLSRTSEFKLTSSVKYKKDDQGNRIESGHTYYKHVPFTADDVESGLKYATNPSVLKANKKTESQVRSEYEQRMFAFYPEPGKPMYVSIHDPALAKAFFYMNNQQAVWANSVAGWMFGKIDSMAGAQEQAELQDKFLYHSARLAATGYFGMNKISKSFITAAPAFIYNTLFRDLPGAKIRSRAGLRWMDIPGGFVQSAALMFPSLMEVFPEKFDVARDASTGMATFSGLSASNADGNLDANVLMSLTRGRGEKMAKAKAGHYGALASLMWGDMKQFFAKEGLTTAPGQMWSETWRGLQDIKSGLVDIKKGKDTDNSKSIGKNLRVLGKHTLTLAGSPFTVARAAGQFAGSIIENATRLTERGLMMSEDMSQYPSLLPHYDASKAINGKILAGTTGTIHRAKWEMAKAKLKMDPNYKVPEDAMPVQSNLTERDNAMSHVTVHFPQKGYWTASMDQLSMFYNPMVQDFYTNMMIITRHSALQKATAYALGENYQAAQDQVKLDSAAWAWGMKSLFYVTIPMMIMMAAYGGDDDDSQDWQAQSFIEKSSYFWVPTNKLGLTERPLRVASGLGLFSLMFKDLPMAGMLEMQGRDPKAMNKWMRRFFDSTPFGAVGIPLMDYEKYGWKPFAMDLVTKSVPVMAPESINPIFELMNDRQQFRDKAIAFPQELSREDPTEVQREKYNMLTNYITKAFSSARMQPAQVQYLISRYFTGSNRWLPVVANKAMELSQGAEGVPQDVQSSNSPLANQSSGWAPRVQAREAYGIGNEFVQDLLSTAREAAEQRKSYESMNPTRKPGYLAEHKLIQEDIYFGKRGADGYRSGGLQTAAKKVIEWERSKKEALKAGRIDKVEALLLEKQYTLFAMEAMRNVMYQLGE